MIIKNQEEPSRIVEHSSGLVLIIIKFTNFCIFSVTKTKLYFFILFKQMVVILICIRVTLPYSYVIVQNFTCLKRCVSYCFEVV